jgi:rhodanese-related sulfurtransferase
MAREMDKSLLNKGYFAHGIFNLTPGVSLELSKTGAIIIDVRENYMNGFKMFGSSNVIYAPFSELGNYYQNLPADRLLIFADAVGLKSREAVLFMKEHGYENIANMAGGIVDWERDGLPLTTDIRNRLTGSCMCQLKKREGESARRGDKEQSDTVPQ